MRPLLPLADPNVLEESKIIGRNQHSTKLTEDNKIASRNQRLSEDHKIVSRSQSLEEKPLVSDKYFTYCLKMHDIQYIALAQSWKKW